MKQLSFLTKREWEQLKQAEERFNERLLKQNRIGELTTSVSIKSFQRKSKK